MNPFVSLVFILSLLLLPAHTKGQAPDKTTESKSKKTAVKLAPIAVKHVGYSKGDAILKVKNRTPFMINVYIHGVRVGWMKPHRMGMIRGLKIGYHKLYAHSQYGTVSWGPSDIWVPGMWNLLLEQP